MPGKHWHCDLPRSRLFPSALQASSAFASGASFISGRFHPEGWPRHCDSGRTSPASTGRHPSRRSRTGQYCYPQRVFQGREHRLELAVLQNLATHRWAAKGHRAERGQLLSSEIAGAKHLHFPAGGPKALGNAIGMASVLPVPLQNTIAILFILNTPL